VTIKEIKVEYGRTVNLGNFESERVAVGLAADLGPEEMDDPGAERRAHELLDQARDIAYARLREFERERRLERHELRLERLRGARSGDEAEEP
jgi:hypothetical protein